MKRGILSMSVLFACLAAGAQFQSVQLDKSPMDMSYYPVNYPLMKIQDKVQEPLVARVIFSRPQKNGRTIFGDLVEYGKVWRMGANEATEIEFFRDVTIGNKVIKKGRYTLYALVNPDKWTMILNRDTDTWGAFKYDSTKDVLRMDVPVSKPSDVSEVFSIQFEKTDAKSIDLVVAWDDEMVRMPIRWP
jgi:hypothetical protein